MEFHSIDCEGNIGNYRLVMLLDLNAVLLVLASGASTHFDMVLLRPPSGHITRNANSSFHSPSSGGATCFIR